MEWSIKGILAVRPLRLALRRPHDYYQGVSWGFSIGVLIVLAIVAVIVFRGWQMTRLTHHGVAAEGTVIKKGRSQSGQGISQAWLRYEYLGPDGQRYEYRIHTSEEFWDAHEVGDTIEIVYVSSKPSVSGAKYMVNHSREALKLPPL